MRLNPGQQQAVEFVTGPLAWCWQARVPVKLLRVITNKIAHLIRGCGYQGATYRGGDLYQ